MTAIQLVPFSNENLFKHLFKIFQNKTKSYSPGLSVRITHHLWRILSNRAIRTRKKDLISPKLVEVKM